jgi:hypothetical protein
MSLPSLEEMTAWGTDETLAEVYVILPTGWKFNLNVSGDYPVAEIVDEQGEVKWEDGSSDLKMLLFHAYGWLRNLLPRSAPHPEWGTRRRDDYRIPCVGKVGLANAPSVPDPADLDPDEIATMYGIEPNGDE